ncbi:MAG: CPBP family intramembrane metalloprotease [Gemmatimonadetes bacterium]|nr:CPBP family intramembrane metalloprotease [Gemmatimonadota bacterium]
MALAFFMGADWSALLGVFAGAATEEIVFRLWLTQASARLARRGGASSRRARLLAFASAAVTFALAHIAPRATTELRHELLPSARLIAIALLLSVLMIMVGLWAAMAVHAVVNVQALMHGPVPVLPGLGIAMIVAVGCLAVLDATRVRWRPAPLPAPNPQSWSGEEGVTCCSA